MSLIRKQILEELSVIEEKEQVKILYACESGSRAWGFPSKDSDYDVRFIYARKEDWYLSIFEKRDVIERPISDMLDINGWDLKKAFQLYRKSNPPLLEWLQSPIIYREQRSIVERIRDISSSTFSAKSCLYHYLNMAKGNYREYLQGKQVKVKKYFYVLRPILCCVWLEKYNTMPPISFNELIEDLIPSGSELRIVIDKLLLRKIAGEEMNDEARIDLIHTFLEERMLHYETIASSMESAKENIDQQLDHLFRVVLKEAWS